MEFVQERGGEVLSLVVRETGDEVSRQRGMEGEGGSSVMLEKGKETMEMCQSV